MVNNILAAINGNTFTADAVPLSPGDNTITAVAANNSGQSAADTITIHTETATDPVILSASPLSGTSPLNVSFTVTADIQNPISGYEYDFDNNGTIDYTSTTSGSTTNTYTGVRLYHPVIRITDNTGLQFTNANPVTINVHLPSKTTITFASGDPADIVNDNNGNIYVLDSTASTVYIYDTDGNLRRSFGSSGAGQGQFVYPKGIAVDNTGDIYVADTGNSRIQKFDSTGAYLLQWSAPGSGVAVEDGYVYVSDTANNMIEQFDTDGNYISGWGGVSQPKGIHAEDGYVYVADSGNNRVQKFTASGSSVITIPGLNNPADVTLGGSYIYVADTGNARVVKYDSDGNMVQEIKADLVSPIAVAHGSRFTAETIYVVDNGVVKEIELPVTSPAEGWNTMLDALKQGRTDDALAHFTESSRDKYYRIFTNLGGDLSAIVNSFPEAKIILLKDDLAELAITRQQNGEDIIYFIYLLKDKNGVWKISTM